jgi:hypothetical protein
MKSFCTLLLTGMTLMSFAQQTPCFDLPPHGSINAISLQKDFGDTITFEEYSSGTIITDQYLSRGAIFSGLPNGAYCDTYDYGELTYGKILKSSSWYDIVKLEFVDPNDASVPQPIKYFGYDNPVDSEIDYIVTNFYDANDALVYTYTSTSPEIVSIDLTSTPATYVTFDDEQGSAYVLDDIWFLIDSTVVENVHESEISKISISPNPFMDQTVLTFSEAANDASIQLFDTAGKLVFIANNVNGFQYILERGQLLSGLYCYRVTQNGVSLHSGNIRVR